jgi:aspartate kinase
MKFGGTSIQDASAIHQVVEIITRRLELVPILVFSAIGKTTRELLKMATLSAKGEVESASQVLEQIREHHFAIGNALIPDFEQSPVCHRLGQDFEDLEALSAGLTNLRELSPRSQDNILSFGELMATEMMTAVLRQVGIRSRLMDSRDLILTDERFTHARPLKEKTYQRIQKAVRPVVDSGDIPVLQGFIGSSSQGVTTTLGFEGSDFTAALIGAALEVSVIQVWKDVPGIMSADPAVCPEAFTIPTLTFDEASELSYLGAKILHPDTIEPAREKGIPVHIGFVKEPDQKSTVISLSSDSSTRTVKSITYQKPLCVLQIHSHHLVSSYDFIKSIFDILDRERITPIATAISEARIALAVRPFDQMDLVMEDLRQFGKVSCTDGKATVSVVGEKLDMTGQFAASVFQHLDQGCMEMLSYGASPNQLTLVVNEHDVEQVVNRLHELFFHSL